MANFAPALPAEEVRILGKIRAQGRVYTVLRETGSGDYEGVEALPQRFGVPSSEIGVDFEGGALLRVLHALRDRGLIECEFLVHSCDSSEYLCTWIAT